MDTERERVRRLLDEEFPHEIRRAAIGHVWKSYEQAWATAREFDKAQMRKVYGHHRLALTEQSLKLLCRKYSSFLTAEDFREPGGAYDYFTMRTKSLLVTVKAVKQADDLPPSTIFRDTIATGTQYHAFDNVAAVDGRKFFHVLFLHGCERKLTYDEAKSRWRVVVIRSRPGFAVLAVPEREGKECILRTPLFKEYPDTIASLLGVKPEDVADKSKPKAKPPKRDETKETGLDGA